MPIARQDEKKIIWEYFCVDQLHYHGRYISIIYDESGSKYPNISAGLTILVDGQVKRRSSYLPARTIVRFKPESLS
jgi:hypothetical protein